MSIERVACKFSYWSWWEIIRKSFQVLCRINLTRNKAGEVNQIFYKLWVCWLVSLWLRKLQISAMYGPIACYLKIKECFWFCVHVEDFKVMLHISCKLYIFVAMNLCCLLGSGPLCLLHFFGALTIMLFPICAYGCGHPCIFHVFSLPFAL